MAQISGRSQYFRNAKKAVYEGVADVIEVNRGSAREVFAKSQALVEVDTGRLRKSGKITETKTGATIVYTEVYAAKLEFSTKIQRKNGQPFYLHGPMTEAVEPTGTKWQSAFIAAIQRNSQGG